MKQNSKPLSVMPGAESFMMLQKNPGTGILLLHGFLGNPAEMKYLGERLYDAGFSVYAPRYPGHGTTLEEMAGTDSHDWYTAARESYLEFSLLCDTVYIAGLSMGGAMTILLAEEFTPDRIALLSTPHTLKDLLIYLTPIVGLFKDILYEEDPVKGINWPEIREKHLSYNQGKPVRQVWSLFRLIHRAMAKLPSVTSDLLIIQSSGDETIPENSMDYICNHIASPIQESIRLEKSNHCITVDYDRDRVAEACITFFGSGEQEE